MRIVTAEYGQLHVRQKKALGKYRYDQFVNKLGWNLPSSPKKYEWDEFDNSDTRYVIAQDELENIMGCARLLPTTRPYLLKSVFSDLCEGAPPESVKIWELSRFTTSCPNLAVPLFHTALEVCRFLGATDIVGVVTRAMERYYKIGGINFNRIGPAKIYDGESLVAISLPSVQKAPEQVLTYMSDHSFRYSV